MTKVLWLFLVVFSLLALSNGLVAQNTTSLADRDDDTDLSELTSEIRPRSCIPNEGGFNAERLPNSDIHVAFYPDGKVELHITPQDPKEAVGKTTTSFFENTLQKSPRPNFGMETIDPLDLSTGNILGRFKIGEWPASEPVESFLGFLNTAVKLDAEFPEAALAAAKQVSLLNGVDSITASTYLKEAKVYAGRVQDMLNREEEVRNPEVDFRIFEYDATDEKLDVYMDYEEGKGMVKVKAGEGKGPSVEKTWFEELSPEMKAPKVAEEGRPEIPELGPNEAREFESAARERYGPLLEEYDIKLPDAPKTFDTITAKLPKSSIKGFLENLQSFRLEIPGSELAVGLLYFWGDGIRQVFKDKHSTDLQKSEAVLSIVPIVGCSLRVAEEKKEGKEVDATNTALCYTADALMLAGFFVPGLMEVAFAVQFFATIYNMFWEPKDRADYENPDYYLKRRQEAWDAYINNRTQAIGTDEFVANATRELSSHHSLVLHQASFLDVIAQRASGKKDLKTELKGHTCAAMAEAKYHLQRQYQHAIFKGIASAEEDFRVDFRQRYLIEAYGKTSIARLDDTAGDIDDAARTPLDLQRDRFRDAIQKAMQRVKAKTPCLCGAESRCEFGACHMDPLASTEDMIVTYMDGEQAKQKRHHRLAGRAQGDESCEILLVPCPEFPVEGSQGSSSRPLVCKSDRYWYDISN